MVGHVIPVTLLNTGFTIEYFNWVRNIPDSIDLLQILFKGEMMKDTLAFNIFVEISS
jgi:hypothetical protein